MTEHCTVFRRALRALHHSGRRACTTNALKYGALWRNACAELSRLQRTFQPFRQVMELFLAESETHCRTILTIYRGGRSLPASFSSCLPISHLHMLSNDLTSSSNREETAINDSSGSYCRYLSSFRRTTHFVWWHQELYRTQRISNLTITKTEAWKGPYSVPNVLFTRTASQEGARRGPECNGSGNEYRSENVSQWSR